MKITRILYLTSFMFFLSSSIFAFDFGLVTNQYAGFGYQGGEKNKFTYQADILPRLSFLIGDSGDFILSAGITLGVDDGFYFVPELLRTEFTMRFGNNSIRAGRMSFQDPLSFIASGLFDGFQFSSYSKAGIFNIGAWYTGLLYKKSANITMTSGDLEIFESVLDYGDFFKTYFAPRRILASVDWEHPSIAQLFSLKASVTGQADFSDNDEKYHSQYLILKTSVPVKSFLFELGGSLETAQGVFKDETNFTLAFAWDLGIFWTLPASFLSRLSLTGHFAGGRVNDLLGAFVPVTAKYYGEIFQPLLSGITVFGLNYTARLSDDFGVSVTASHFVRNDLGTYTAYPVSADSGGYFLGTEFFAKLIWSPVSDVQLNFGGGAFLPVMGNAGPDEKARWRIDLAAILSLY